jgi:hypothetical protein
MLVNGPGAIFWLLTAKWVLGFAALDFNLNRAVIDTMTVLQFVSHRFQNRLTIAATLFFD